MARSCAAMVWRWLTVIVVKGRGMMADWDKVSLAFDVLENADVMEEFEDYLWIRVNREDWEAFFREEAE